MLEVIQGSNFRRMFFFLTGIIATIAYRAIVILDPAWTHFAWYIGTIGFILYFGHRANIQKKRSQMVKDNDLIKIVSKMNGLKKEQKNSLDYLVRTAVTSKSRINSLFIFWLSIVALVIGIIMDLLV